MKFLGTYALTLALSFLFAFCGGCMLFDFSKRFYVALAAVSLVIALVIHAFMTQAERIEQLESRVKALESQNNSGAPDGL